MQTHNYGEDPYSVEASQLANRRKLAELLMAQSLSPSPVYSNKAGIAKMLTGLLGGLERGAAEKGERDLADRKSRASKEEMEGILAAAKGEEGTPQRAQLAELLARSSNPHNAQAGLAMLLKPPVKLDWKDGGDRWVGLDERGREVTSVPKGVSPDTKLTHGTVSANTALTHTTPSAGAILSSDTTRSEGAANRGVTVRGQNMTDSRSREEGDANRGVTVRGQDLTDARSRDALGNKPVSEGERTAGGYAMRMEAAEKILQKIPTGDLKPGVREAMLTTGNTGAGETLANSLPSIAGGRSDARQMALQAQRDWVRAKLRKESGAVIGEQEMENEIRTYFPQIGDAPAVVAQKAAARREAMNAMNMGAGRAAPQSQGGGGWSIKPLGN